MSLERSGSWFANVHVNFLTLEQSMQVICSSLAAVISGPSWQFKYITSKLETVL